ncbi:MAG: hypothetical protein HUU10_01645 [Bacteroidetes bacterium]|nr:hypothetical protein [Bacteroidota bacterium]
MRRLFVLTIALFLIEVQAGFSQVQWSGLLDAGFSMGEVDSKTITNGIGNRYPNFSIMNLHLFFGSQVTDRWSVSGKFLYAPGWYGEESWPRLAFASLNYDSEDETWGVSAGRLLTPFGLYPKRQHSTESISFTPPLAYGFFINMSRLRGFWPKTGDTGSYGSEDVGLTPATFLGYQTGFKAYFVYEDFFESEVMVSNEPVSTGGNLKANGSLSVTGRLALRPAIWAVFGFSGSYGSFMTKDAVNSVLTDIEENKQLTIGVDGVLAYSYFELSGEYLWSRWTAPMFKDGVFVPNGNGIGFRSFSLTNHGAYADLKFDIPQIPGLFLAGRFDRIWFDPVVFPDGKEKQWDIDTDRLTAVVGYTIDQGVLIKLVGFKQTNEGTDPKDDGAAAIMSFSF